MAGIFLFSSLSDPLGPASDSAHSGLIGRAAHALEYAGLAALLLRALGWRRGRSYGVALLVTLAYALSDELHQAFVPGREFSLLDLAVDAAGALAALGLVWLGTSWRAGRRAPRQSPDSV
jgi:VanZ family protein